MANGREVRSKHNPTSWSDRELVDQLIRIHGDGGSVPSRVQWESLLESPHGSPVILLNMFKLRAFAKYTHQSNFRVSGFEAFARYVEVVTPILTKRGVEVVFSGQVEEFLLGITDQRPWDNCAAVRYPSRSILVEQWLDPEYEEASRHKVAAVDYTDIYVLESFTG